MTTVKQILRWIAVLPGALVGAVIVMFPVHWVAMYIHHFGTPDPMITHEQGRGLLQSMPLESFERFGDALFVAGALIGVGASIAPRFHFATAIVLTLLVVSFLSWAFVSASSMGMHIVDSPFRMVITAILWLVSVASALSYAVSTKEPNQAMQPTAGSCTAWFYIMNTRPLQATPALASGG